MERGIDLNEQLIHNKPATFFMRVRGNAMTGAGIHDGDIVIIDRSMKATSGRTNIAMLNGELLIRRLKRHLIRYACFLKPISWHLLKLIVPVQSSVYGVWLPMPFTPYKLLTAALLMNRPIGFYR